VIDAGKHRHALGLHRGLGLFIVSFGPKLLWIVVKPCLVTSRSLAIRLRSDEKVMNSGESHQGDFAPRRFWLHLRLSRVDRHAFCG
jgi:hypothetical protein